MNPEEEGKWNAILATTDCFVDSVTRREIKVTALERDILSLPIVQRLGRIQQLGHASSVFVLASHSRLAHSLGTLDLAQQMIDCVNENAKTYSANHTIRCGFYEQAIIRLAALLHDVAHIPYAHTLEEEANLYGGKKQWKNTKRVEALLDSRHGLEKTVMGHLARGFSPQFSQNFWRTLVACLRGPPFHEGSPLHYTYDMINGPLGADLLDYLRRDAWPTGIVGVPPYSFLRNLALVPLGPQDTEGNRRHDVGKDGRATLVVMSWTPGDLPAAAGPSFARGPMVSEILDLLRLRYYLTEGVYYHPQKVAFATMLAEAVNAVSGPVAAQMAHEEGSVRLDAYTPYSNEGREYLDVGDHEMVIRLQQSGIPEAVHLATRLLSGRAYKTILELDRDQTGVWINRIYNMAEVPKRAGRPHLPNGQNPSSVLLDNLRNPVTRANIQADLTARLGFERPIIVSCPPEAPFLKKPDKFNPLVVTQLGAPARPLTNALQSANQVALHTVPARHALLWRLRVLVDPDDYESIDDLDTFQRDVMEIMLQQVSSREDPDFPEKVRPYLRMAIHRFRELHNCEPARTAVIQVASWFRTSGRRLTVRQAYDELRRLSPPQ